MIADAKYKPIDNIGNKDYLQVLAYMFRFDAKKGFYFYPEMGEEERALLLVIPLVLRAKINTKRPPCLVNFGGLLVKHISGFVVRKNMP